MGSVKLGQPQPDSYLSDDASNGSYRRRFPAPCYPDIPRFRDARCRFRPLVLSESYQRFLALPGITIPSNNQRKRYAAASAPSSSATRKPGTSRGAIPANVSLSARAMVTAGLAKDVDEVNQ